MKVHKSAVRFYFAALISLITLMIAGLAAAAPTFPALTGRVVDEAGMLQPATKAALEQQLAQIEKESSDQLVVVTLKSLEGYEIEEYGYQLGRAWGIGQAKLNNGVLLIVAPNERKVRIEVGYGLEGTLTDAVSHEIISEAIIPRFKEGNMEQGVVDGVNAIDQVLKLSPEERQARAQAAEQRISSQGEFTTGEKAFGIIFIIVLLLLWKFARLSPLDLLIILMSNSGNGGNNDGGWGGGDGGGFSGGGGSFGGGGSSGSW